MNDGAHYESTTQTWRTLPPAPLATDRGDAIGVWTGTEIVVANGISGHVKSAAFHPTTFTWRTLSDPPIENAANATSQAVMVEGSASILVYSTSDAPENQVIRLDDPQSGQWTAVPKPPLSLQGVRLVAAGTDVLVVGQTTTGNNGECNVLHILDYSASDNSWRELPAAPATNRADTVAVWTGSELFIGGGDACDNGVATGEFINRVSLLNPNTGTRTCGSGAIAESSAWSSVSEPPSATISPFFPIATQRPRNGSSVGSMASE